MSMSPGTRPSGEDESERAEVGVVEVAEEPEGREERGDYCFVEMRTPRWVWFGFRGGRSDGVGEGGQKRRNEEG
jgi:hypothetical protein